MSAPTEFTEYEVVLRRQLRLAGDATLPRHRALADLGVDPPRMGALLTELESSFGVVFPEGLRAGDATETVDSLWWTLSTAMFCQGAVAPARRGVEGCHD